MFNMLTCEGWADGFTFLGSCTLSWAGFGLLVFICMIARRQIEDRLGASFSLPFSFLGVGVYALLITLTGNIQLAFVLGIVGILAGGFVFNEGGSEYG